MSRLTFEQAFDRLMTHHTPVTKHNWEKEAQEALHPAHLEPASAVIERWSKQRTSWTVLTGVSAALTAFILTNKLFNKRPRVGFATLAGGGVSLGVWHLGQRPDGEQDPARQELIDFSHALERWYGQTAQFMRTRQQALALVVEGRAPDWVDVAPFDESFRGVGWRFKGIVEDLKDESIFADRLCDLLELGHELEASDLKVTRKEAERFGGGLYQLAGQAVRQELIANYTGPIPHAALGRLARGQGRDDLQLKAWVKRANEALQNVVNPMPLHEFHLTLLDVASGFGPEQAGFQLGRLYVELEQLGLEVDELEDPFLERWKGRVRESIVVWGMRRGAPERHEDVLIKNLGSDRWRTSFGATVQLANKSRIAFLKEMYRASPDMRGDQLALNWIVTGYIDPEGKYAFVSDRGSSITRANLDEISDSVVEQFTTMVARKLMPEGLTLNDIRLADGGSVAFVAKSVVPIDPIVAEEVLHQLADTDYERFLGWMEAIGLAGLQEASLKRTYVMSGQLDRSTEGHLERARHRIEEAKVRATNWLDQRYRATGETTIQGMVDVQARDCMRDDLHVVIRVQEEAFSVKLRERVLRHYDGQLVADN